MKTFSYLLLSLLLGGTLSVKGQHITRDFSTPEYVYPNQMVSYTLSFPSRAQSIDLTVNGGKYSINPITPLSTETTIYVTWENVKVSNGKCIGTITGLIHYSGTTKYTIPKFEQKILSLNDVIPPDIELENGKTSIPFGVQELSVVTKNRQNFKYPNSEVLVNQCEWKVPDGWINPGITNGPKATIKTDIVSEGEVMYRGINNVYQEDKSVYSYPVKITRTGNFTATPYGLDYEWGTEYNFSYTFMKVDGVTYEWYYPSDWTVVSGANTYSIVLKRPKYSNSGSSIQVRLKDNKTGKTSKWFSAPALTFEMPTISGDEVVETGSQFSVPGINPADVTWSISGSDEASIDQNGIIKMIGSYPKSAILTIKATIAGKTLPTKIAYYYAKYIDGYSVVDGRNQQFYAGPPNHDPECGVYSSSKVDMHVTEPNFFNHGGTFEWTMQSGSEKVQYFNPTNHSIAHFEVRPQASAGLIQIHVKATRGDFLEECNLNYYVMSYYIAKTSSNILTIEKEIPEDMPADVILLNATNATKFEYQIIETSTGIVRMSGSYPVDQRLELDVSSLRSGIYTVIVTENGEVKAQQNISL